jgi:hypothetical protein
MIRATAALTVSVSSESLMQQMKEARNVPVNYFSSRMPDDVPSRPMRPNSCVVFNAQEEIVALKADVAALREEVAQLRSSLEAHVARGPIGTFHGFPRKGDAGDIADWCVLPFHSKKHTDELHNVITRIIFWVKTWHHMKGDQS